jgi:hypothetical protein
VLTLTLLILLIIGVLVGGMCEVAANADEQAERDYAHLMKLRRKPPRYGLGRQGSSLAMRSSRWRPRPAPARRKEREAWTRQA